jgi:hypothetical protein
MLDLNTVFAYVITHKIMITFIVEEMRERVHILINDHCKSNENGQIEHSCGEIFASHY